MNVDKLEIRNVYLLMSLLLEIHSNLCLHICLLQVELYSSSSTANWCGSMNIR